MKFPPPLIPLFLLVFPHGAAAQNGPVAFPQVTALPVPLQSSSGRFSSLNPANRIACPNRRVTGRVVSVHLIMVAEGFCGRGRSGNVLVNVAFADPADAAHMVVGRRVTISGDFTNAEEERSPEIYANYLIAEKAKVVSADRVAAAAPAFTSYIACQPPELDAMAAQLGSELCVQNTLVDARAVAAPALMQAARAPGRAVPSQAGAILCRPDERSDLHLPAMACARADYWAWYDSKWRDYLLATPAPP